MLLKLEIDLTDVWQDEDESTLADTITSQIHYEAKKEVWDKIKGNVNNKISEVACTYIDDKIQTLIDVACSEIIDTGVKVSNGYTSKIDLKEFIEKKINDDNVHRSITKYIDMQATNYVTGLKERYDMLFASQVVMKMSEQGLLKDDMLKKLVSDDLKDETPKIEGQ